MLIIQFSSAQFFIYVLAELSSQWPITDSASIQATIEIRQRRTKRTKTNKRKQGKMNELRHFTLKHELLKILVYLQMLFAAETHWAVGQWLKEQLNLVKLHMF